MKTAPFIVFVAGLVLGCGPTRAPVMKRMASGVRFDEQYLKDVFVPAVEDPSSRMALSNSVNQLEEDLSEFRTFMGQVEVGKIAVTENMKGGWQSYQDQKYSSIFVGYFGRLGSVSRFDKRSSQPPFPLIYGFFFYTNGYLRSADALHNGFFFDERGRVETYYYNTPAGVQELTIGNDGKIHYRLGGGMIDHRKLTIKPMQLNYIIMALTLLFSGCHLFGQFKQTDRLYIPFLDKESQSNVIVTVSDLFSDAMKSICFKRRGRPASMLFCQ